MSRSVAVSASLTRTPPKPRKDPSTVASAIFRLISGYSHVLKAAASSGALVSTMAETSLRLANERCIHSAGFASAKRSRIARMLDPPSSDLSKSAIAALMSSLELGIALAAASAKLRCSGFFKSAPQAAWIGRRNGNAGSRDALQHLGPFFRCEIIFISHGSFQWTPIRADQAVVLQFSLRGERRQTAIAEWTPLRACFARAGREDRHRRITSLARRRS